MIDYPIHIGEEVLGLVQQALSGKRVLVLVDENTSTHCYPVIKPYLQDHELCEIASGEIHKTLDTCIQIWQKLTDAAFDRKGIVLNLGGGVIGDMGGFVAGTYKRGIQFIQMPTTLLSQVDASVGGKLGVDFRGFKNHIGLFREPEGVYIYPPFLQTLPKRELISGFAEIIKHHLIADKNAWQSLSKLEQIEDADFSFLIQHSVDVKAEIVKRDPFENGPRKALNFGHTIGHAIESLLLESDSALLHGEAIAIGMICETYISQQRALISEAEQKSIEDFISRFYPHQIIPKDTYPEIYQRCINDKKNLTGKIMCTLLEGIGAFKVNQEISQNEIYSALDHYNSL